MTDQLNHLTKEVIDNTQSDLEALIMVNLPSKYVRENTEAEDICKNMANDILKQFNLTYKIKNPVCDCTHTQACKECAEEKDIDWSIIEQCTEENHF